MSPPKPKTRTQPSSSDPLRGYSASARGVSPELFALVRAIGEAKSKQEEQKIIETQAKVLETKFADANVPMKKKRDLLVRLIYVDMLGHQSEFGHIHAINMTQNPGTFDKRVGYLAAVICLSSRDSDLRLMLVNSYRRDLQSSNHLHAAAALSAMANLITSETVPAVLDLVVEALKHPKELVRRKAAIVFHRFWQIAPGSISHMEDSFRRALCDPSPSVMGATLNLFVDMAATSPNRYRDLTPSFVSILKQVIEVRLPGTYNYHGVPSPWIQIKLLKILAILGRENSKASEQMSDVLLACLRRAVATQMTAAAASIAFECCRTITSCVPSLSLLESAASAIGRFLSATSSNLRYLGVTALAWIVSTSPQVALKFQLAVIDCLESPDETLRKRTLDLLVKTKRFENYREKLPILLLFPWEL